MLLEAWVQVAAIRKPSADQVSLSLAYTTPPPCPCCLCYPLHLPAAHFLFPCPPER